uniref:Uncharacterized protein n=1 Tax=Ananas comosus var. bracteatus TaxID=296719 RepID=A0A6V7PLC4_ANACO|nr:unnamed protein product [Ananas comosus var. bracteatus]
MGFSTLRIIAGAFILTSGHPSRMTRPSNDLASAFPWNDFGSLPQDVPHLSATDCLTLDAPRLSARLATLMKDSMLSRAMRRKAHRLEGGPTMPATSVHKSTEPENPQPEPWVEIFVGLVPVQGLVYRYKEADFVQFELQGCFGNCGLLISTPTPLRPPLSSPAARGEKHEDWILETWTTLACHLCSFAHACEGRSLQAGTPELVYATYVRSCGIEMPTGSSGIDTFQE